MLYSEHLLNMALHSYAQVVAVLFGRSFNIITTSKHAHMCKYKNFVLRLFSAYGSKTFSKYQRVHHGQKDGTYIISDVHKNN